MIFFILLTAGLIAAGALITAEVAVRVSESRKQPEGEIVSRYESSPHPHDIAVPLLGNFNTETFTVRHRMYRQGKLLYDLSYTIEPFRERSTGGEKGKPQILCVGCSYTFGHSLNDEDTWPWKLQQLLPSYTVVNKGALGFGTDQALLMAEDHLERNPGKVSLVILGFNEFHLDRNVCKSWWLRSIGGKPRFILNGEGISPVPWVDAPRMHALLERSALMRRIRGLIEKAEDRRKDQIRVELTVRIIKRLSEICEEKGSRLLVLFLPYAEQDKLEKERLEISRALAELAVPFVEIVTPQKRAEWGYPYFLDTKHPSALCCQLIADNTFDYLNRTQLIPVPRAAVPCSPSPDGSLREGPDAAHSQNQSQ